MSKTIFNTINDMGDEKHNLMLRIKREQERKEKKMCHSVLWDIWNKYLEELENEEEVEDEEDIQKQEEFFEHFFKNKKGGANEKK